MIVRRCSVTSGDECELCRQVTEGNIMKEKRAEMLETVAQEPVSVQVGALLVFRSLWAVAS